MTRKTSRAVDVAVQGEIAASLNRIRGRYPPESCLWLNAGLQSCIARQWDLGLKALREHALVESAVSSNRIEGVEVDQKRVGTIVFGKALLRDRDEEEVRGYRKALDLIHTQDAKLAITEAMIRQLHALSRGGVGDAGEYKQSENDIVEVHPDGRREVRFHTARAADTPPFMAELIERHRAGEVGCVLHARRPGDSGESAGTDLRPPVAYVL